MKKDTVPNILAVVGALIGYGIAKMSHGDGSQVLTEITSGMFLFFQLGRVGYLKNYSILIGALVGLLISIGSDILAGSEVVLTNKLLYMSFGLIVGWPIGKFLKPALVGGGVGGVIGFAMGLNSSHLFGKAFLPPGILNAFLFSVFMALSGFALVSLAINIYFGWKFRNKSAPPS